MKSQIFQLTMAYMMAVDPGPALCLLPRDYDVKSFVRERVDTMIRDNEPLRDVVMERKSRDSGNTLDYKAYRGGQLNFFGANAAQNFASRSARYGWVDEWDRCPRNVGVEGSTALLFRTRFTNFSFNSKILWSSTPTIEGMSNIEVEWKGSDQRYYHVPCPHCGEYQKLIFDRLRWDEINAEICWYDCVHCDQPIEESNKWEMLCAGKWIAENPKSKVPGFTLSQLYSPVQPWQSLVALWLKAKGDRENEKTFRNTRLGELHRDVGDAPAWQILKRRAQAEKYEFGKMPEGALVLTAGADVQKDRIELMVRGWAPRNENWVVDYQIFRGKTASPEVWQILRDYLDVPFRHPYGADVLISKTAIDTRYNASECYDFVRSMASDRIMAIVGVVSAAGVFGRPTHVDRRSNGSERRYGLKRWPVNVSYLKGELYNSFTQELVEGQPLPRNYIHLPAGRSDEWYMQLVAEEVVVRRIQGHDEHVWVKRGPNEALDVAVYARAAHYSLGCDSWPEHRWLELRKAMRVDQTSFEFVMPASPGGTPAATAAVVQGPSNKAKPSINKAAVVLPSVPPRPRVIQYSSEYV